MNAAIQRVLLLHLVDLRSVLAPCGSLPNPAAEQTRWLVIVPGLPFVALARLIKKGTATWLQGSRRRTLQRRSGVDQIVMRRIAHIKSTPTQVESQEQLVVVGPG